GAPRGRGRERRRGRGSATPRPVRVQRRAAAERGATARRLGAPERRALGGFGGTPLVVGVRWSFADKDAGSLNSIAIRATEDAAQRASSVRRRLSLCFAKPSYLVEPFAPPIPLCAGL